MRAEKEKLIVTVTTANAWIYPEAKNYPKTPEEIAETDKIEPLCFVCFDVIHQR